MTIENRSWQELCEAASKEPDSGQLMVLISQLMQALGEHKVLAQEGRER